VGTILAAFAAVAIAAAGPSGASASDYRLALAPEVESMAGAGGAPAENVERKEIVEVPRLTPYREVKSTNVALLLGIAPVAGLGLLYSEQYVLAGITFAVQVYGIAGYVSSNRNFYLDVTSIAALILSYAFDVLMAPRMAALYNERVRAANTWFVPPSGASALRDGAP
jgi:hypothetical protein